MLRTSVLFWLEIERQRDGRHHGENNRGQR